MSPVAHRPKGLLLLSALCLALGAAGCSMDDVQFNGGIFDAVGLSDEAKAKSKSGDPKLAARAPLVVPPTLDNLPKPGEEPVAPPGALAEIKDPDVAKQASKKDLERQQAAYCREHYEIPKQRGDDSADSAEGPLGPCRPSVLNAIKNWNSADDGE
jgi:hypothetical protein